MDAAVSSRATLWQLYEQAVTTGNAADQKAAVNESMETYLPVCKAIVKEKLGLGCGSKMGQADRSVGQKRTLYFTVLEESIQVTVMRLMIALAKPVGERGAYNSQFPPEPWIKEIARNATRTCCDKEMCAQRRGFLIEDPQSQCPGPLETLEQKEDLERLTEATRALSSEEAALLGLCVPLAVQRGDEKLESRQRKSDRKIRAMERLRAILDQKLEEQRDGA